MNRPEDVPGAAARRGRGEREAARPVAAAAGSRKRGRVTTPSPEQPSASAVSGNGRSTEQTRASNRSQKATTAAKGSQNEAAEVSIQPAADPSPKRPLRKRGRIEVPAEVEFPPEALLKFIYYQLLGVSACSPDRCVVDRSSNRVIAATGAKERIALASCFPSRSRPA